MLFNSVEFLFVFLPITFFVYFLLNKAKLINLATAWLVVASLAFYSYWKIDYLPLILISMVFNYHQNLNVKLKALISHFRQFWLSQPLFEATCKQLIPIYCNTFEKLIVTIAYTNPPFPFCFLHFKTSKTQLLKKWFFQLPLNNVFYNTFLSQ